MIGKYRLVLDKASLTTVLNILVVNVIMPELHNRSIFTKCFCSFCVCVEGWVMTVVETDGGVTFGEGCRRKAG